MFRQKTHGVFSLKPRKKSKFYKRMCMMIFFMPFIPFIPRMSVFDDGIYYSITMGLCTYVFFINFPGIIKIFHTAPDYYNDLEDTTHSDYYSRKQHQSVFIFSTQILIALITSSFVYYYQYKYPHSNLFKFEMVGVLSAIASMMFNIYKIFAKIIQGVVKHRKKRNSRKITIDDSVVHRVTFSLSDLEIKKTSSYLEKKVITV